MTLPQIQNTSHVIALGPISPCVKVGDTFIHSSHTSCTPPGDQELFGIGTVPLLIKSIQGFAQQEQSLSVMLKPQSPISSQRSLGKSPR